VEETCSVAVSNRSFSSTGSDSSSPIIKIPSLEDPPAGIGASSDMAKQTSGVNISLIAEKTYCTSDLPQDAGM